MAITAQKLRVEVEGDTSKAQKALGDLEAKGKGVPGWVGAAKASLAGLFGIGVGAGALFTSGLLGSIDAAEGTAKVKAQMGLTGPESAKVGQVSGKMFAGAYGDSMGEVSSAVGAVMSSVDGMRGATAPILEAATGDVMSFAKAFDQDIPRVAQIAGQAVRQGLAPDFQSAMDLMTKSSQMVPEAVRGDLLDAVDEYGGFFTQLGFSGEEGFSALARGAQEGMYGIDKTGDALKELTIRATDGSKLTTDAYAAMGLSSKDMAADILAGGDQARGGFDKIVKGLLAIKDPQEQANAAIALFGTPLEDLGTNEIPGFLKSLTGLEDGLGETSGVAAKMTADLNSGPGTALTTLKRSVSLAFIGFTDTAIPALTSFATTVSAHVGPAVQALGGFVTSAIATFQGMVGVVQQNQTLFTVLASILAAVFVPGLVLMGVQAAIAQAKIVALWVTSKAQAIASVAAQTAAMARIVVGWVAAGAAAVVSGAQTAYVWALYRIQAAQAAAAHVAAMARVVAAWVAGAAAAIAQGAVMVAQSVATAARVVASWVLMGAAATVQGARIVAGWVMAAAASIAQGAVMAAGMAATAARVVAGWVLMGVQSMIQAARMAAAWFIALGPIGWVTAAVIAIAALVIANWDKISAWTAKAWAAVVQWVTGAWRNVTAAVNAGVARVRSFVQSGLAFVQAVWSRAWQLMVSLVTTIWGRIVAAVSSAAARLRAVVTAAVNGIRAVWTSVMNAVRAVAQAVWSAIVAVVRGAISNVLGIVRTISQVVGAIRSAFTSAKTAATGVLNSLVTFVRGIPGKLVSVFQNAVGTFRSAGSSIINGLKEGITGAFGRAKQAVSDGLGALRNLLPFSPAKEGPFSGKGWTLYSGRSIPEALGEGIRDRMGVAKKSAQDMVRAVSADMALPEVTGGGLGAVSRATRGRVTPEAVGMANGAQRGGQTVYNFNTYNPLPEAPSTTVNKSLAKTAGLSW